MYSRKKKILRLADERTAKHIKAVKSRLCFVWVEGNITQLYIILIEETFYVEWYSLFHQIFSLHFKGQCFPDCIFK